MATIICVSKYPPLEGGIAAKTYWLAKALAERGHRVHVVTDWIGVDEIHSVDDLDSEPFIPNVTVHRASGEQPWIVPSDQHRVLSLWDKVVEVARRYSADVIDSNYLVPYGLAGYLASRSTGLPLVIRHGGSDIRKFVERGIWSTLWREVFSEAAVVITDNESRSVIQALTDRSRVMAPYMPDPRVFNPAGRDTNRRPVLASIGKANYYWRDKGWHRVIDIWSRLGDRFEYLIVSQGNGLESLQRFVSDHMSGRITWEPFVAPWHMPDLLRAVDVLFHFQNDLPFPAFSNVALEAVYCGSAVVVDRREFPDQLWAYGLKLPLTEGSVLAVPPTDPSQAAMIITKYIEEVGGPNVRIDYGAHNEYVDLNEELILSAVNVRRVAQ